MEEVVALMGDASEEDERHPHEELRMDRVLVRRQIIGRTMYPSNAGRGQRYRQGAGHQSGMRRGPKEMRGGGQWNRRERRRTGHQGGNNRGRNRSGMPPQHERGGVSRKEWNDSNHRGGYGGQFGSLPYQYVGAFGPRSNHGGASAGPSGANPHHGGGQPGHFGAAQPHIDPPGQFGPNPGRGPFGQGPGYGSVEPFGHGLGGSGSCGKGPTYVFNFSNN